MKFSSCSTFACVFLLIFSAHAQDRPVIETSLQPAETAYKISQVSARDGVFQSIDGVMTDRSEQTCDGYKMVQKIIMRMYPAQGGQPMVMRIGTEMWEAADGLKSTMRNVMSMNNQKVYDYSIAAEYPAAGVAGTASRSDNKQQVTLPAGSMFLTTYMRSMLSAAGQGKSSFEAKVFDGDFTTGDKGIKHFVATIGAPRAVADKEAKITMPAGTLAWPVELSMYDPSKPDGGPIVQNGFSLLPNGMSEAILMDIQTAKLRLDLDQVKLLPKPDCSAAAKTDHPEAK
jgi:hypothetical protein